MPTLLILHTNDIHGRVGGLARVVTQLTQRRTAHDGPVLYVDIGDSEEHSNRLSNLTGGVAMHRLLAVAGCDAVVPGNAVLPRYGPQALAEQAAASPYPHLLANLRTTEGALLPGAQPTALLEVESLRVGLIGLTAPMESYSFFDVHPRELLPLARELAAALRQEGADLVVVLSHLGLEADRALAKGLQGDVVLILGGHSHDLLPEGEWLGTVLVAQAGEYAEHLGIVEIEWDGEAVRFMRARVEPVPDTVAPHPEVLAEAARVQVEVEAFLADEVGELAEAMDYATDRECRAANLLADALREQLSAEVAVLEVGHAFTASLPAGRLTRGVLWDACPTTANPGTVHLTGVQLQEIVRRGLDPQRAADRPRPYRGLARGFLHLSGANVRDGQLFVGDAPVDPARSYLVAGSDAEFEPNFGYVQADWNLQPQYQVPTILRQVLAAHLATHRPARTNLGRLGDVPDGTT